MTYNSVYRTSVLLFMNVVGPCNKFLLFKVCLDLFYCNGVLEGLLESLLSYVFHEISFFLLFTLLLYTMTI